MPLSSEKRSNSGPGIIRPVPRAPHLPLRDAPRRTRIDSLIASTDGALTTQKRRTAANVFFQINSGRLEFQTSTFAVDDPVLSQQRVLKQVMMLGRPISTLS